MRALSRDDNRSKRTDRSAHQTTLIPDSGRY